MHLETISDTPSYIHLAIRGDLDTAGSRVIDLEFHARTAAQRKHAIVDMSEVRIIASLGMGMLIGCAHSLARHKKRMMLVHTSPMCAAALRAVKMDQMIAMYGTVGEALASMEAQTAGA